MVKMNNPFKIWLSYVGAFVGLLFSNEFTGKCGIADYGCVFNPVIYLLGIMVGFLIGWVIFTLIKKVKKW